MGWQDQSSPVPAWQQGSSVVKKAASMSPHDQGVAAGQQEGALASGLRSVANAGLFGAAPYVAAGIKELEGSPNSYADELAFARGQAEGSAAAHPVASLTGEVAGSLAPGGAAAHLAERGLAKVAPKAAAALVPQAGQGLRNVLRYVGTGALAGGAYGAATGAVQNADQGPAASAQGAGAGGTIGAVTGAATAPLAVGATKVATAVKDQFAPVAKRSIKVLADKLDMNPAALQTAMADHYAATGRHARIADVLAAKDKANLAPAIADHQSSAAAMMDANDANRAALPRRASSNVAQQATQTPFGVLSDARVGDLKVAQDDEMNAAMGDRSLPGALGNQRVLLTSSEQTLLHSPLVRDAVRGDATLRGKLADLDTALQTHPAADTLTVDDFERLRQALRGQQASRLNVNSPRYSPQAAGDYGAMADTLGQVASQQHPAYGQALDAYGRQQDFIEGFLHGQAGKSIYDVPQMGDIRTLRTPEGRAGLEVGARSRLINTLAENEAGAVNGVRNLRQGSPSKTLESLSAPERTRLQQMGAVEERSQRNFDDLTPGSLTSADQKQAQAVKTAAEGAVAIGGHALTGFKAHALYRILTAQKVREDTANDIVRQLTTARTPQDVAALTNTLNRARVGAATRRLVLKQVARYTGTAASGAVNSLLNPQQ